MNESLHQNTVYFFNTIDLKNFFNYIVNNKDFPVDKKVASMMVQSIDETRDLYTIIRRCSLYKNTINEYIDTEWKNQIAKSKTQACHSSSQTDEIIHKLKFLLNLRNKINRWYEAA